MAARYREFADRGGAGTGHFRYHGGRDETQAGRGKDWPHSGGTEGEQRGSAGEEPGDPEFLPYTVARIENTADVGAGVHLDRDGWSGWRCERDPDGIPWDRQRQL